MDNETEVRTVPNPKRLEWMAHLARLDGKLPDELKSNPKFKGVIVDTSLGINYLFCLAPGVYPLRSADGKDGETNQQLTQTHFQTYGEVVEFALPHVDGLADNNPVFVPRFLIDGNTTLNFIIKMMDGKGFHDICISAYVARTGQLPPTDVANR